MQLRSVELIMACVHTFIAPIEVNWYSEILIARAATWNYILITAMEVYRPCQIGVWTGQQKKHLFPL